MQDAESVIPARLVQYDVWDIENARHLNPQGTIDHLLARKDLYKRAASQHLERARELQKEITQLREQLVYEQSNLAMSKLRLKDSQEQCQKELTMKNLWKIAFGVSAIGLFTVTCVLLTLSHASSILGSPEQYPDDILKTPTSGRIQQTPRHVLASVNIYNGSLQGSGTADGLRRI